MTWRIETGNVMDVLPTLPAGSIHCCVTSPPYWGLRDYGVLGQLGIEKTPDEYVANMVSVFREVRRALRDDGTLWLNLGDSYANDGKWGGSTGGKHASGLHGQPIGRAKRNTGLKPKDLVGIPWRVAFALQSDGWWLRQDIIWHKPNPMPESVRDRCTKAHEYMFMLSKSARYYYDADAIKEPASQESHDRYARGRSDTHKWADGGPGNQTIAKTFNHMLKPKTDKQRGHSRRHAGFNERWDAMERSEQCSGMRNKRSVWTIATQPYPEAHFATYPETLVEPCVLAGCPAGGLVLDPFNGSGTTGAVCVRYGRDYVGVELNPAYVSLADVRIRASEIEHSTPLFDGQQTG